MKTLLNTQATKNKWTDEHYKIFNSIPPIVRDIAGDLFELKWYGCNGYDGMLWEVENNLLGKKYVAEFKQAYDKLTIDQKNLIYYAYEA